MKGLWDSGLAHVLRGESTVDELMRVVDVPQEDDTVAPSLVESGRRPSGKISQARFSPVPGTIAAQPPPGAPAPAPLTAHFELLEEPPAPRRSGPHGEIDRKSTRLNSSHLVISYAVFCLKKKKI